MLAHLAGARSVGREGAVVAIRWDEDHDLDRWTLKRRLPDDVRIGRHRLSVPVDGHEERWLPSLRSVLSIAGEVEGGRDGHLYPPGVRPN